MNTKQYWEKIHQEKDPTTDVSWYQARPAVSLELITAAQLAENQSLIDVGGRASVLVPEFELIAHRRETHTTPWGSEQKFQWSLLKKIR